MRICRFFGLAVLTVAMALALGCRIAPSTIAMTLVGDGIADADVKSRHDKLAGEPPAAADEMFGERVDTFVDTKRKDRELILYKVKGDLLDTSRYLIEVQDGKIVAVTKKKKNRDGVEDVVKQEDLKKKLIGKGPSECERAGEFKRPTLVLRIKESGNLVRIYDVANWTHLGGARYCVLRFDADDRCEDINLVGLVASSKKGGTLKG